MKSLFHVAEVMKSLSSIIKGQRVRHESTLEIESLGMKVAPKDGGSELTTEEKEEKVNAQLERKKIKAKNKADGMIEKAKAQAEKMLEDAQKKIEKDSLVALENAKEEGYSVGYTKGYDEGALKAQRLIEEAQQIITDANAERKQLLDQVEPEVIEMIIAITRKLINAELEFNPETIFALIRKALGENKYDTPEINIKVSSDQYAYVLENKKLIVADYANPEDVEILQDADLPQGACTIETPFGSIGCNIQDQFTEVKKQMRLICDKSRGD